LLTSFSETANFGKMLKKIFELSTKKSEMLNFDKFKFKKILKLLEIKHKANSDFSLLLIATKICRL